MISDELFPKISARIIRDDGVLSIFKVGEQLPFVVKRVYTIDGCVPQLTRGCHAHKQTRQALFCLRGSVEILLDNGKIKKTISLDNPHDGVLIQQKVWHRMDNISKETLMLVFANTFYDENDYIRNYQDFLRYVKKDA